MSKANFFKRKKLWLHFKENRDDDFIGEDVKNWSYDDDPQHFYKSRRFGTGVLLGPRYRSKQSGGKNPKTADLAESFRFE